MKTGSRLITWYRRLNASTSVSLPQVEESCPVDEERLVGWICCQSTLLLAHALQLSTPRFGQTARMMISIRFFSNWKLSNCRRNNGLFIIYLDANFVIWVLSGPADLGCNKDYS